MSGACAHVLKIENSLAMFISDLVFRCRFGVLCCIVHTCLCHAAIPYNVVRLLTGVEAQRGGRAHVESVGRALGCAEGPCIVHGLQGQYVVVTQRHVLLDFVVPWYPRFQ